MSAGNELIVSGSRDKSVKIFSMETKEMLHYFQNAHNSIINPFTLSLPIDSVTSVAVSANGRLVVSGSSDRSIRAFKIEHREETYHTQEVHSGKISPMPC